MSDQVTLPKPPSITQDTLLLLIGEKEVNFQQAQRYIRLLESAVANANITISRLEAAVTLLESNSGNNDSNNDGNKV